MATTALYGYNPNRAGDNLLKFCSDARKRLMSALVKPSIENAEAFQAWVMAKIEINRMDHAELRKAIKALDSATGQYANRIGYSDVEPYEIVRVVSDSCLEVRPMLAVKDPSWKPEFEVGGFVGHCTNQASQRWIITSDENASILRLRLRKDGYFHNAATGYKFRREAAPRKFYDYNF